jgi:hypothetical protein
VLRLYDSLMGLLGRVKAKIEYRFLPAFYRNTLGIERNGFYSKYCKEMRKIYKESGNSSKMSEEIRQLRFSHLAVVGKVECDAFAKSIEKEFEGVSDPVKSLEQEKAVKYADEIFGILKSIDSKLISFYKSYYIPYWIQIQRNNPGQAQAGSAFQWHTDDNPTGVMKIFVYLNDVKKSNGAFRAFPKWSTTYLFLRGFRSNGIQTRVDAQPLVNRYLKKYPHRLKILEGDTGTLLGFDNNLVHKGTLPEMGYRHVVQILLYPSNKPLNFQVVERALLSKRERDYPSNPYEELVQEKV